MTKPTAQPKWVWPIDTAQYDHQVELTAAENVALAKWVKRLQQSEQFLPEDDWVVLERIWRPIRDVLGWFEPDTKPCARALFCRNKAQRYMAYQIHASQQVYWGWHDAEWQTFIKTTIKQHKAHEVNHDLMALAYILGGVRHFYLTVPHQPDRFASKLFGYQPVQNAQTLVAEQLRAWGYGECGLDTTVRRMLSVLLIENGSPYLYELGEAVFRQVYEAVNENDKPWLVRISRVLHHLNRVAFVLKEPGPKKPDTTATVANISEEWVSWYQRWRDTSTLAPQTKHYMYYNMLKVGRWLAAHHPDIASPAQWTRDIAVEFVAAVDQMCIGDYNSSARQQSQPHAGQPLRPAAKVSILRAISIFFRDCQAWEWIPIRFDPKRWFATPRSIRAKMGPAPGVIADAIWAKLLWAGLNLTKDDLPPSYAKTNRYPFELVRAVAVVWLFAGLRHDEIRRLRVGCIRWQTGHEPPSASDAQAVCLLDVPVTKTGQAFTKPIAAVAGEAIAAWETVRPKQPQLVDPRTGERADLLFAYRGKMLGQHFVNGSIIPVLCLKAGIPEHDARGRFTSHRARATIASQLVNTRQPLSLFELQQWLGHSTPSTTLYYVQLTPTKLRQAYTQAGYFDRNLRTISVLIDQDAIRKGTAATGEAWRYYDLGHGYCTYDFFDQCPHRMACARCSFYVPKHSSKAQILEAKANLQKMLQEIPLADEERAAVEDGVAAMEKLCERLADVPTPAGPTPRELTRNGSASIPLDAVPVVPARK